MRLILSAIALMSTALSAQPAAPDTRNDVTNAIVMVAVRGKASSGNSVERNGTGFIVGASRNVITANHVVAAPPEGWAKTDFGLPDFTVVIRFRDQQTGLLTEVRRASVQKSVPDKDTALLEFEGLPRGGLTTCPDAEVDQVGTQLNVAGSGTRRIWQAIALEQALRLDKGCLTRCPECHGRVRVHSAGREGMSPHFEHRENNPGCTLGYNFDGTRRRHRKPRRPSDRKSSPTRLVGLLPEVAEAALGEVGR